VHANVLHACVLLIGMMNLADNWLSISGSGDHSSSGRAATLGHRLMEYTLCCMLFIAPAGFLTSWLLCQVVAAAVAGPQATMVPSPAADMWALGVLGYEMMTGQPLFGTQYSNNDVIAMLLGWVSTHAYIVCVACALLTSVCDDCVSTWQLYVCILASVVGFPVRAAVSFLSAEVAHSLTLHMHCCKKTWSIYVAKRVWFEEWHAADTTSVIWYAPWGFDALYIASSFPKHKFW